MRLQATMHYLLHICIYRYVYIRECMPIYAKSPKVTITFIRRSKIVIQEMYGISDFESIKCGKVHSNPNQLYGNSSCHHGQVSVHGKQFFLD